MPDHRQAGQFCCSACSRCWRGLRRYGRRPLWRKEARPPRRRFRPGRDGTPAHDHLGDIIATLDAQAFRRRFVSWVAAKTPTEVIAIDGKASRRSYQKKGSKEPIHMVSTIDAMGGVCQRFRQARTTLLQQ